MCNSAILFEIFLVHERKNYICSLLSLPIIQIVVFYQIRFVFQNCFKQMLQITIRKKRVLGVKGKALRNLFSELEKIILDKKAE